MQFSSLKTNNPTWSADVQFCSLRNKRFRSLRFNSSCSHIRFSIVSQTVSFGPIRAQNME